jgi:hypothetical protein
MGLADFLRTPRTNFVPSIMQFPSIDIDGLKRKLKLEARARSQGQGNLPPQDSAEFDPVERDIVGEIEGSGREQFDAYQIQQNTYAQRASDTSVQALILRIASIAGSAIADFQRETHAGTGELYALKRDVIETEAELTRFRESHRLSRPPRNFGSRWLKLSFLLLILAIEGVLNGLFLSKGNQFGLVGGVLQALIIATINIAVGLIVGRFVMTWLWHRNGFAKTLGAIGTLIYLGAAFGFNIAVAHYRNAVGADPFTASAEAYEALVHRTFDIADLESWALFVMGFLFSIAAAYDGWMLDDPYPGYGQRIRHNLEALEEYNERKQDLFDDLDKIKKAAEDEIDDVAKTIENRHSEFTTILARSQSLRSAMAEHFDHLETAGNTLLIFYRNENRKHRSFPAPDRFNGKADWSYPKPNLGTIDTPGVTEGRAETEKAIKEAFRDVPQQRKLLNEAYTQSLDEYKRIDDLVAMDDVKKSKQ